MWQYLQGTASEREATWKRRCLYQLAIYCTPFPNPPFLDPFAILQLDPVNLSPLPADTIQSYINRRCLSKTSRLQPYEDNSLLDSSPPCFYSVLQSSGPHRPTLAMPSGHSVPLQWSGPWQLQIHPQHILSLPSS